MRKDIKLGFAIGGVLLAVLIVYILAVTAGESPVTPVTLDTTGAEVAPADKTTADKTTADATTAAPADKAPDKSANNPIDKPTDKPASKLVVASGEKEITDPAIARPAAVPADGSTSDTPATKPAGASTATPVLAAASDAWDSLLNNPPMMSRTPTPADKPTTAPSALSNAVRAAAGPAAGSTPTGSTPAGATPPAGGNAVVDRSPTPAIAGRTGPSTAPTDARTHVIRPGENFSLIAKTVYGNAAYYAHLMRANPNVNPNNLKPGTVITIPPEDSVKAVNTVALKAEQAPPETIDPSTHYRVQSGDNLHVISSRLYGKVDRATKIYELNQTAIGPDPGKLKVGQVLRLPEAPAKTN